MQLIFAHLGNATFLIIIIAVRIRRKDNNMLLEELKDFCGQTTIHGLGQIANNTTSVLKRLLWFGIFVGCLCYAGQQLALSFKGIPFIFVRL